MFKKGLTKVPIEKVPALAKALHLDPAHLLMLAMREYMPEAFATIQKTLGHTVTENEFELVSEVRKATKDSDPVFSKVELAKIRAVVLIRGSPGVSLWSRSLLVLSRCSLFVPFPKQRRIPHVVVFPGERFVRALYGVRSAAIGK